MLNLASTYAASLANALIHCGTATQIEFASEVKSQSIDMVFVSVCESQKKCKQMVGH